MFWMKVVRKLRIDIIMNRIASSICRLRMDKYNIMSIDETINYIIKNKCSVARYGDGELLIAAYGTSIGFQKSDECLKKRLVEVLTKESSNVLICIIGKINCYSGEKYRELTPYWKKMIKQNFYAWTKYISANRIYGDASLTRFVGVTSLDEARKHVEKIKKIWEDRNIIIVEGEKTRIGVGNDLIDNVTAVKRVLCPSKSAFDLYSEILEAVIDVSKEEKDPLVLIALGPTATVLAYDLGGLGIQALDIGHIDICYERFLTGNQGAIPGKYTNESLGGDIVGECNDAEYVNSIVRRIY